MSGAVGALFVLTWVSLARVGYYRYFSPLVRAKRILARRRRTPIRDAAGPGLRVTGRVRLRGKALEAPVSGRACVAFQLAVQAHSRNGWRTVLELREAGPFVVADESGQALVDTAEPFVLALVASEAGSTGWTGRLNPERRQALQALLGARALHWQGGAKNLRYQESILDAGRLVSIGGQGVREASPEGPRANLREPGEWLVLRGRAGEPLLISNAPETLVGASDG
jgi:hypothetical protein